MAKKKESDVGKKILRLSYVAIICAIGFAVLAVFPGIDLSIPMRIISGIMVLVALGVFVGGWQESRLSRAFEKENSVRLGKNLI